MDILGGLVATVQFSPAVGNHLSVDANRARSNGTACRFMKIPETSAFPCDFIAMS
jgi:hypothetical protein